MARWHDRCITVGMTQDPKTLTNDQLIQLVTPDSTYAGFVAKCRKGYVPTLMSGIDGQRGRHIDELATRLINDGIKIWRGLARTSQGSRHANSNT